MAEMRGTDKRMLDSNEAVFLPEMMKKGNWQMFFSGVVSSKYGHGHSKIGVDSDRYCSTEITLHVSPAFHATRAMFEFLRYA
jgi:hypothetical protein